MILFLWLSSDFYHWFICICGAFISLTFTLRACMNECVRSFGRSVVCLLMVLLFPLLLFVCFISRTFSLFILCVIGTQCRALATTSRVTGRFLACVASPEYHCAFFAASIFSPTVFSLSLSLSLTFTPHTITTLHLNFNSFFGILWLLMGSYLHCMLLHYFMFNIHCAYRLLACMRAAQAKKITGLIKKYNILMVIFTNSSVFCTCSLVSYSSLTLNFFGHLFVRCFLFHVAFILCSTFHHVEYFGKLICFKKLRIINGDNS